MNDADLIAALGWTPCDANAYWCSAHDCSAGWADGPCGRMCDRLIGARAGIDLARNGIAEAIEHTKTPLFYGLAFQDPFTAADSISRKQTAQAVREWQP